MLWSGTFDQEQLTAVAAEAGQETGSKRQRKHGCFGCGVAQAIMAPEQHLALTQTLLLYHVGGWVSGWCWHPRKHRGWQNG